MPLCHKTAICIQQFIAFGRFKSSTTHSLSPYRSLSVVFSFPGWLDAIEYLFKFQKLLCHFYLIASENLLVPSDAVSLWCDGGDWAGIL